MFPRRNGRSAIEDAEDRCLLSGGPINPILFPRPQLDPSAISPDGDQLPQY